MEVVEIDRFEAEVRQRAVELVVDERRLEAVPSEHEVVGVDGPGVDVLLADVPAGVGRPFAVEGDEPALGGDENCLAVDVGRLQRLPDDALAALVAVVDCGVEDVDPGLECRDDRPAVRLVGLVRRLPKVGAQPILETTRSAKARK